MGQLYFNAKYYVHMRVQSFGGRRRGSPSVGEAQKSITHESTSFLCKISRAYAEKKSSL
ncbi:uncharacterized protein G2W53_026922 [Senna tora]|uniref:Uncharacterized protein n=1 Tax=Senna tora TaxID=362788 RepID=A0A834WG37_9FABA|nr:uncharacterized protein G2W53_026922 [Senna tora]